MEQRNDFGGLGSIFLRLSARSKRPRYAFLVLQLVAEAADGRGKAGPFLRRDGETHLLRDWLCRQLAPLSERDDRRSALRERVKAGLACRLTGEAGHDDALIDEAVREQAATAGRSNVSRAISELVEAGLIERHYAGYATNHRNRGGGRHAVYTLTGAARAALGAPACLAVPTVARGSAQGQLFAI